MVYLERLDNMNFNQPMYGMYGNQMGFGSGNPYERYASSYSGGMSPMSIALGMGGNQMPSPFSGGGYSGGMVPIPAPFSGGGFDSAGMNMGGMGFGNVPMGMPSLSGGLLGAFGGEGSIG